jgi:putative acetyltransferase
MNPEEETASVERESPRQAEVIELVSKLDAHVAGLYPPESNHSLDLDAFCGPEIRFFVARYRGTAVGCGALREDPSGYGEVKRMFVDPSLRGKGVGRAILRRVEQEALSSRLSCVRLETGTLQAEALGLYRSEGYREIPPFGDYRPDPLSVFMEKRIAR